MTDAVIDVSEADDEMVTMVQDFVLDALSDATEGGAERVDILLGMGRVIQSLLLDSERVGRLN